MPNDLIAPGGAGLAVDVVAVRDDGDRILADVVVPGGSWMIVEGGLLFHLDETVDTDGMPPSVSFDEDVAVTLRLGDDIRAAVTDAAEVRTRLGSDDPTDPLRQTESWFAVRIAQGGIDHETCHARAGSLVAADGIGTTFEIEVGDDPTGDEFGDLPPLLAVAERVLREVELEPERFGPELLHAGVEGDNGRYHLLVHTRDRQSKLLAYATADFTVPEDRRPSVMLLITRINPSLTGSWLEMDLEQGTVSARCTLLLEGIDLDDDTYVENVIATAAETMDQYLPALVAIGLEGYEPDDFPEP